MMKRVVFAYPGNEVLSEKIRVSLNSIKGDFVLRHFPDGESYLRLISDVMDHEVVVVATLHQPNQKILSLLFFLRLLKEAGASRIILVSPYLAYMRQDKQFKVGEAVTSTYFAELLSPFVDELITIDPHLHRRNSMSEIYNVPCKVLHASSLISLWIKTSVSDPVLIGPDSESEQWVSKVAAEANAPFLILKKERHGDRDVVLSFPEMESFKKLTPVLVDDIISTARTMTGTVHHLIELGFKAPVCIGVHAIFADNAFEELQRAGTSRIVTCNTIPHPSNAIDVSGIIVNAFQG